VDLLKYCLRVCLFVALLAQVIPGAANQSSLRQGESLAQGKGRLDREEIQAVERQLAELGYWTGEIDGVLDPASRQALVAFQKAEGRKPGTE
jgi:peptidoglycan hydrolase-like protein with peptidoglycan-binding domain